MNLQTFHKNILELIRRTSAFLPPDVENVISLQRKLETAGSKAEFALELVAQNIGLAKAKSLPICQDTGTIGFYFETPAGIDQLREPLCKGLVEQPGNGLTQMPDVRNADIADTDSEPCGLERDMKPWRAHRIKIFEIKLFEDIQQHERGNALSVRRQLYDIEPSILRRDRLDGVAFVVGEILDAEQPAGCLNRRGDIGCDLALVEGP